MSSRSELPSGIAQPCALDILREGTRARHHALDSRLPIARKGADQTDYARHLSALYGWLKPLNTAVWSLPWPQALDAPRRAGKVAWLEQDLHSVHGGAGLPPVCPRIPQVTTLDAYAMGVAYVIEGSQLGGAILARRFPGQPVAYLAGYGDDMRTLWDAFQSFLNATLLSTQQHAQALDGACDAFDTLNAWLHDCAVLRDAAVQP